MINIAKLLKDAPKGMKLYSPLFGEVEFAEVMDTDYVPIRVMKRGYGLRFDEYGRYMGNEYPDSECLLFPSKDCRTWEEWKLPVQPKSKVGDWIVGNEGIFKITQYEDEHGYDLTDTTGCVVHFVSPDYVESNFHLWTIQDAKDGDVLAAHECYVIFKEIDGLNIKCYCTYHYMGFNPSFHIDTLQNKTAFKPATKEEREQLFKKMQEAGYQWDGEKKELRKVIEPNFKIGNWICPINGKRSKQVRVIEVRSFSYLTEDRFGILWPISFSAQHEWRLWMIQDANDGDVLVCYSEVKGNPIEQVGIFFGKYAGRSNGFLAHTGIDWNGNIIINGYMSSTDIRPATKEQRELLFQKMREAGYQWDAEKKELKKIIEPQFKVGDSIVNDYCFGKVIEITNDAYLLDTGQGIPFSCEHNTHLWTIQDARNGDVLVVNGNSKEYKWIGIFKAHTSDTSFSSHCHYNCGMCEFVTDIARCTKHGTKYNDIRPATNEERDILFAKMKEAGYEWNVEKKELRKIQSHYDIANFHAGMPVLVRDRNENEWCHSWYSHYCKSGICHFNAVGLYWKQCIPYEGNEHLLGTTDMCPEEYINW